ncbi:MAG: MmgE/PrpD family protein [Deltaproteobacteria bacterium]|nr:MmgE/PrpD family protein [Deltaproteobacteria bacterium]
MVPTQLLSLCQFLSGASLDSTPLNVINHAKLVLLDTLGAITGGSGTLEVRRIAEELCGACGIKNGASCPGRTGYFHPLDAALINGTAGSSLEYEEGNSWAMGHPAIQIVPAILAASEAKGLSGGDLLMGLIGGYEAATRVSRASSIHRGLHPNGTWGLIGCALGVACVHKKDPDALFEIANIAASYALSSYVKNSFVGKNVASTFAGVVNYLGFLTNLLFDSGFRADPGSFEATFSQFVSEQLNAEFLSANLGKEYAITTNYFKPYPTCRFTHPAIDALKAILERQRVNPHEVDRVTVSSFKAAVHTSSEAPDNVEAMRFSLPYQMAVILTYGKIGLDTMNEESLQNPTVADLARKVELVFCPEYEQLRPRNNPATVTVLLKGGRPLSHEVMNCLGDPLKLMPEQTIHEKFLSLTEPILGKKNARDALKRLASLEHEDDIRSLFLLLRPNI